MGIERTLIRERSRPAIAGIDGIIVLNLKTRSDRRSHIVNAMRAAGLDGQYCLMMSDKDRKDPVRGIYNTHRRAVLIGESLGWRHTLIVEDDAVFEAGAVQRIEAAVTAARERVPGFMRLMVGHVPVLPWPSAAPGLCTGFSLAATAYVSTPRYARWFPEWRTIAGINTFRLAGCFGSGLDHAHSMLIGHQTLMMVPSAVLVEPAMAVRSDHPTCVYSFLTEGLVSLPAQRAVQYAAVAAYVVVVVWIVHAFYRAARCPPKNVTPLRKKAWHALI